MQQQQKGTEIYRPLVLLAVSVFFRKRWARPFLFPVGLGVLYVPARVLQYIVFRVHDERTYKLACKIPTFVNVYIKPKEKA
jgi:hypothetical protein